MSQTPCRAASAMMPLISRIAGASSDGVEQIVGARQMRGEMAEIVAEAERIGRVGRDARRPSA